ncbi:hypothetical protein J6590_049077 [Homalodisca vitripennis]|nr:hypothetical protein J6590_049077 [Homalodisca vitripennis]
MDKEPKGKKRKCQPELWKANKREMARIKGESYINSRGIEAPAVNPGPLCRCRMSCSEKIGDNVDIIFARLHSMVSKNEQDIYLQGLIDLHDVRRRRPREPDSDRANQKSFTYNVLIGDTNIQVYRVTFLAAHGVTVKRIKRLQKLAILGKGPNHMRGYNDKGNAIPRETKILMKQHMKLMKHTNDIF